MRIAILNRNKNSYGGQEQHAQYLANELSKKHSVSYVSIDSQDPLLIINKQVKTVFLKRAFTVLGDYFSTEIFSKKFRSWLSSQDYLIINNPLTLFAAQIFLIKSKNQKVITIFHSKAFSENFFKKILHSIKKFFLLQIAEIKSDRLVFLTRSDENYFCKKLLLFKKQKSVIIPNGIDTKIFFPNKVFLNKKSIIFVGKLTQSKGVRDLIEVAKKMPLYHFTFVGDGPLKNELLKLKNCTLKGKLEQDEIAKEYRKHNIFILPSYSESFPLSIIEAMASGLYVITSDIYGLKDIILPEQLKNDIIIPGDIKRICYLIKKFFESKSLAENIKNANVAYARKYYSVEKMGKKYLDLLR